MNTQKHPPENHLNSRPAATQRPHPLLIENEFAPLLSVIIGLGEPYQEDKNAVLQAMGEYPQLPKTEHYEAVLRAEYPTADQLKREFAAFVAVLHRYGVQVSRPDPTLAYSFDYTCPRDIGFVIGDKMVVANMSVASRAEEFETIRPYLQTLPQLDLITMPENAHAEGGDVIVMGSDVLVGINQRTNEAGYQFLKNRFEPLGYAVHPVYHRQLHLDCCYNPLGLGHALVHPGSLSHNNPESTIQVLKKQQWVTVTDEEREHLAPNVLSIAPNVIVARQSPHLSRVNARLNALGYTVEELLFDGVPATGGSFRCASLVLNRKPMSHIGYEAGRG